jgi:hypothetical protein
MTVHPLFAALDSLNTRIQGLRSKTTDNGCTESEALLAAAKVAELLDRYDLSLTDVEIRDAPCEQLEYETYRKKPFRWTPASAPLRTSASVGFGKRRTKSARWYPPAVGGAAVRCREVLGTPIGLPPLKREGPRRSTRREVFEISLGHCCLLEFVAVLSRPVCWPSRLPTGGPSCGSLANRRCSASAVLNRLAHRREETGHSPAIALHDRRKLGALGERHTHAVDANVADLVAPFAYREPPINFNRWSLRTNNLAGHHHAGGIGPATVHLEAFAAILGC